MYVIHSHLTFEPGQGGAVESNSAEVSDDVRAAPGFVERMMLRDTDHPGQYFYISLWEDEQTHHAYQARRVQQIEAAAAASGSAAPPPVMVRCQTEVVFHEFPAARGASHPD